jgi:hypothetical protein
MSAESPTPLLDRVRSPEELRALEDHELPQLAAELRQETIDAVSVTGGHLGAGLGVVELTIALHKVFDTPNDKLIWDVGHQTYPIRSLRAGATASAACAKPGGRRASASGPRANTTHLAQATPRPRSRRDLAWRLLETSQARNTTWFA